MIKKSLIFIVFTIFGFVAFAQNLYNRESNVKDLLMGNFLPNSLRFLKIPTKSLVAIALLILTGISNSLFAQNWDEVVKVVATDRAEFDYFGYSVSISGDYAIVGAKQEDHNVTGGQFLDKAGAAYILRNNSGTWTVVQKIVASDRAAYDEFGTSVAISGNYAVVGAPKKDVPVGTGVAGSGGAAYIFKNTAGIWSQVQIIRASDRESGDQFGYSVAISGDFIIVGAPFKEKTFSFNGSAYIFKKGASNWVEEKKIFSSSGGLKRYFGWSVGISGDYVICGMPGYDIFTTGGVLLNEIGSAVIFERTADAYWTERQIIIANDREAGDEFGTSVAISGDYAIVGAMNEDNNLTGGAMLNNAGSAYIYKRNGITWSQMNKIVASDRAADDLFGYSVAISGDYAIVGAYNEDEDKTGGNTLSNAGSAYVFKNTAGNWAQANKIVASDRDGSEKFGYSVAISGDYAIVGAYLEDINQAGGNSLSYAGASYVFKNCIARSTDTQTSCGAFTWIDGNTYTANNNTATYNFAGGAASGCDSLVTLNLTITGVTNLSTTISGKTITANNTSATYRWLDCSNNYAVITGETGISFTPTVNGSYAVELTENGCIDTSACQAINFVGLKDVTESNSINVYPNPTSSTLVVSGISENTTYSIIDLFGKEILSGVINENEMINIEAFAKGVYFLQVITTNGIVNRKFIKD